MADNLAPLRLLLAWLVLAASFTALLSSLARVGTGRLSSSPSGTIVDVSLRAIALIASMMDAQARRVLVALRSQNVSVEAKSGELNELKSTIKHHVVADGVVAVLFEIVRVALASQHSSLVGQGLSTMAHLVKRLHLQEYDFAAFAPRILPLVIESLGDRKDRHRALAQQCLGDFWLCCPPDAERLVRETAMCSKNPRTKESSMQWLATMTTDHGLQFKSFVPRLMELLEDADGMVRKVAVTTVVELFRSAPDHAKADLKRQLQQYNVRKTITADITSQLGHPVAPSSVARSQASSDSSVVRNAPPPAQGPIEALRAQESVVVMPPPPMATSSESEVDHVEPAFVNTQRELEEAFRDMAPHFEGRESEQNWTSREKDISRLRKLTKGNAPTSFYAAYLVGIKGLLDGILKTVNSLRTTVSTNGCALVQEMAKTVGPGLDPMVEILLQNLIKLCAATKNISRINGNATVDILFSHVSYSVRILQHVWTTCQDKNVRPRLFASGWLATIIKTHGHHRHLIEHSGGLEYMEKSIKKGLSDADIGVRESMRKTFWTFAKIWSGQAEAIMATLDSNSRRLLEKDPANPNSPKKPAAPSPDNAPPSPMAKAPTARPSKRSLKETIAAQKREALAAQKREALAAQKREGAAPPTRDVQSRPTSAQATLSPANPNSPRRGAQTVAADATRAAGNVPGLEKQSAVPPPTMAPPSGLASKPMRPPRRPDFAKTTSAPEIFEVLPRQKTPEPVLPVAPETVPTPEPVEVLPTRKTKERIASRPPLSVYQDSGTSSDSEVRPISRRVSAVLSELSLNEPAQPSVSDLTQALNENLNLGEGARNAAGPPASPREHQLTVKLIDSGIVRVRNKSLDSAGFRKLQSVIDHLGAAAWPEGVRFDELLLALVEYLEVPNEELRRQSACFSGVHDHKNLALQTIRALFDQGVFRLADLLPRTICGIITSRKYYQRRDPIVRSLESTAEKLFNSAVLCKNSLECVDALISLLEEEELQGRPEGHHMVAFGLQGLGRLLTRPREEERPETSDEIEERLGNLVVLCLKDRDSGVRNAAVQYTKDFHKTIGEYPFWTLMDGVDRRIMRDLEKIKFDVGPVLVYGMQEEYDETYNWADAGIMD
ncbi:MAG: suppressor of tub2 mutation [Thelocarpon impressellum]|nr:MAG: suppressor of tub2 mutation [Thelocarpon impressellum]